MFLKLTAMNKASLNIGVIEDRCKVKDYSRIFVLRFSTLDKTSKLVKSWGERSYWMTDKVVFVNWPVIRRRLISNHSKIVICNE